MQFYIVKLNELQTAVANTFQSCYLWIKLWKVKNAKASPDDIIEVP